MSPSNVIHHPDADVAILEVPPDQELPTSLSFFKSIERPQMGEDFFAYGFPIFGGERLDPRVLWGAFQTFRHYTSCLTREADKRPYTYFAGELSIPCPRGLSGGPVFRRDRHDVLLAIVTENHEEGTEISYSEELAIKDGQKNFTSTKNVILYGMSVVAAAIENWLVQEIPI